MSDSGAQMHNGPARAVLFDALGTLVALEPPAPALQAQLARRFGVSVGLSEAEHAIAAEIAYYRAHLDDGRDTRSLAALRRRCAEVIRQALPQLADVDGDQLTIALLAALRFRVFADVIPALTRLHARGVRLVVASNWDVSLHEVLANVGIAPLLDGIVTSAEIGARKPAPEIFRRALRIAGVAGTDAIHVGDSLDEDVAGARAAGIEPVLLVRARAGAPTGVRAIATLDEL